MAASYAVYGLEGISGEGSLLSIIQEIFEIFFGVLKAYCEGHNKNTPASFKKQGTPYANTKRKAKPKPTQVLLPQGRSTGVRCEVLDETHTKLVLILTFK